MNVDWRPWQKSLENRMYEDADSRSIYVIYDPVGNQGKSYFAKMFTQQHPGESLVIDNGKSNDLKYVCMRTPLLKWLFIDLTRTVHDFVNYAVIEELKNGVYTSGKYESRSVVNPHPHVVILTNFKLKYDAVST